MERNQWVSVVVHVGSSPHTHARTHAHTHTHTHARTQVVGDVSLPPWAHRSARHFVMQHRAALGPDFNQLSGDDPLALAGYALGQVGCISVTANVAPRLCAEFHAAAAAGDFERARTLNERLFPLHKALFADASPSPTKYALSRLHDWLTVESRLPIVPCSDQAKRAVDTAMEVAGLV